MGINLEALVVFRKLAPPTVKIFPVVGSMDTPKGLVNEVATVPGVVVLLPAGNLITRLLLRSATYKLLELSTKIPLGLNKLVKPLPVVPRVPATTVPIGLLLPFAVL